MGASNSCTCSDDKKYRFKGFIVSVYPDDKHGGPNEDALGKLNSYVGSNPERIPRVCRKINKILRCHLDKGKEDRVMVSLFMLRSLIEHSKIVDGFVPHSIDICALLLSTNVTRYHVGAADVLSVLCHRLSTLPNTNSACRLVADNKDRLVPQLLKMTSDHIASRKDVKGVQTRYAAILALGNIANCIHTALAGGVGGIMQAMIVNLILVLRERASKPLSDASVRLLAERHYGGAASIETVSPTLELPATTEDQDVAYALACSHGIGATAACTTTAGVDDLLSTVTALLSKQNGWTVPYVPSLVFSDILSAMQRRPQQLGFSVYRCLCEVGERNTDPNVRIGVLRSLQACMDALPMTGGRPAVVLDYLLSVMRLPVASTTAGVGGGEVNTETARILKDTHDVLVRLTARLLQSTYRQRNAPQLQNILVSLWSLLRSSQAESSPSPTLTLRLLIVAAPYIRAVPLVDRKDMQVTQTLDFYLNGSDDALRHLAARVLTDVLAGLPEEAHHRSGGKSKADSTTNTNIASPLPPRALQLPRKIGTLCTDEQDVAYAQEWVKKIAKVTEEMTPRCVVAVADVLCALMAGYGISGLPFNLAFLWTLQQQCVRAEAGNSASNQPAAAQGQVQDSPTGMPDDTMSVEVASVATTMTLGSRSATSELTRAWLHMVAAVLVTTGNIYGIPNLVTYGMEVLNRRAALGQLAACFEPTLRGPERAIDVYTVSGLRYLASEKSRVLSAELTEAPVSKLPSFSYVASIIVDADLPDVVAVFGANEQEELHAIIEGVCFQPDSEVNASLSAVLAARGTSTTATGVPKPSRFSLAAEDATKVVALRSLRVAVVDNRIPRTQDSRGALPLSAAATTTEKKVQEIAEYYNVNAATQVLPLKTTSVLPPLPLLPLPTDEDTTTGANESSEGFYNDRGPLTPSQPNGGYGGSADGTPRVNPIDIDVSIRASRKTPYLLSASTLPAGRYVSLS